MGYEIYIWPKDDKKSTPLDSFVNAFNAAGLSAPVNQIGLATGWFSAGTSRPSTWRSKTGQQALFPRPVPRE